MPADTSRVTNQTRPWLGAPIWPMLAQPGLSSSFNASMSGPRPVLPLDTCSNESISGHVAVAPASVPVPAAILQGQQPSQAPCRTRPLTQMAVPSSLDMLSSLSQPPSAPAPKRRRLRSKTSPPACAPAPAMDTKDCIFSDSVAAALGLTKESPEAKRMVYLITFPHTFRPDLVAPETLSREAILCKVGASMAKLIYANKCISLSVQLQARRPQRSAHPTVCMLFFQHDDAPCIRLPAAQRDVSWARRTQHAHGVEFVARRWSASQTLICIANVPIRNSVSVRHVIVTQVNSCCVLR